MVSVHASIRSRRKKLLKIFENKPFIIVTTKKCTKQKSKNFIYFLANVELEDETPSIGKSPPKKSQPGFYIRTRETTYYFHHRISLPQPSYAEDWLTTIHKAWLTSGLDIADQLLTKENVPVIIDKCIQFIDVQGKSRFIGKKIIVKTKFSEDFAF